jgi:endonuclease/exonuclease/phosphatase family metal-dependent hydrolase
VIRVVSWNVLAEAYVRREYYPHTPPHVFDRAKRRGAVAEQIGNFASADVLSLQEADSALFALAETKLPDMAGRLFRKRGRGEGCAVFVRQPKTTELEWRELVFSDRSGHIALGVTFSGMTVVNTHLKWEPEGTPAEVHRGVAQLREILDAWPSGRRIICGDFNAEPDSSVIALAKARGFEDAYASMPNAYTCNPNSKKQRIDYILHTPDFVASPVALPAVDDGTPLPSETSPSDHLPIEARLDRAPI